MDNFCQSIFWNTTLTWQTTDPDFTKCFEKTILVLFPIGFFWLSVPFELYWLKRSLSRDIPWNFKNVLKILLILALCGICVTEFFSNLSYDRPVIKTDIYMPLIKLVTYIMAGTLVYYNKKYGMQASGPQFIFWFLSSLCGAAQFRTEIREAQGNEVEDEFFHMTYLIYYPCVVAVLLLNCFADNVPKTHPYEKKNPMPISATNFLGRMFYIYFDPLLYKGFKKPLIFDDMWHLEYECQAQHLVPIFEGEFNRRVAKNKEEFLRKQKEGKAKGDRPKIVSVLPVIYWCLYPRFVSGMLCRFAVDLIMFINPQILSLLIAFVGSDEPQWKGFLYAFTLFAIGTIQSVINSSHFTHMYYFGLRTRTCLIACVYRKALRISNATRKDKTVGEIVNLMAADAERFLQFAISFPLIWSGPIQITLAIYFLWQEVGPSVLAGLGVMILLIPINIFLVRISKRLQIKQMKDKDERVKMMSEILNGIRVLKLYAWEASFEKIIEKIRLKEIRTLLNAAYLGAVSQFIWNCAPFVVSFATFGTYVLVDENNVLDASKAFVSLALLNLLRQPMNSIPNVVNTIVQTMVSINRISSFLNSEELEPYIEHDPTEVDPLVIENGTFSWGEDPILKNINLRIPNKGITAIVGPVGCGKSSLLNAMLGEMDKKAGRVNSYGSVAYVPQLAWIQNATVRKNIIFGKPFDKVRYNKVVHACALEPDLEMLADGDMTEIGEKGINLSGGQKQRISLARAVYEDADIYLLDDPLSAVDAHVGKHIFTHVIGPTGILKGKVKVLVTHAVTYLPKTEQILVMKDGEIQESGNYGELLSKKGAFSEFLLQHISEEVNDEEELKELEEQIETTPLVTEIKRKISRRRSRISESSSVMENGLSRTMSIESLRSNGRKKSSIMSSKISLQEVKFKKEKGKLIQVERAEIGNIKFDVYKYYFSAIGLFAFLATIFFYVGFQGFGIGSNIWLGKWTDDSNMIVDGKVDTALRNKYLWVYAALGLAQGVCIFIANVEYARGTTSAATKLHNTLMHTVMRLPMSFFDVTPIGRILARFSSDIIGVDMRLPDQFNNFFFHSFKVLGTLLVICYTTPLFTAIIIPIAVLYIFIQRYFVSTTRQVKRLESIYRSPIYVHFSETISGTTVIRAYRCQDRFIKDSEEKIDNNQRCSYPANFANRWLGVRLELLANTIILTSALFAVLSKDLNASMVGLSVSYALQITQSLNMLVRTISDAETNIVSVERIKEYSEVKQEKPWEIPQEKPNKSWPVEGNVKFQDYSVRYRPGLDLVLKNVDFNVGGGEKIGIVGRTGAGKSSLTLSLFRIIEASEGKISIDNVNISEIGLHDLRSKLTIIPQDSVLFSGTLRLNLDPFELHSDEELWKSVELAHLKEFVSTLPSGLYHKISEGGANLSIGQRQLVCLARALLRKTKILILDEATAAVDLETDDIIQKTIRTEFRECTVITIAHRLNTIIDSNRVLVLDGGRIAEYDTPTALLDNKNSIFFGMCKDAGLAS